MRLSWRESLRESAILAWQSLLGSPARSGLAIGGIVIGIVTVVMVATVLANLRNQIALLFRELGTENVFAFHLTGDPYSPPSDAEARRVPLRRAYAEVLERNGESIVAVAAQVIIPPVVGGRALTARAGTAVSDTVLVEGASANFFEIAGAEFEHGRPFTQLEERAGARVAVIGGNLSQALFGTGAVATGREITMGGERYIVVGVLARRRGGFFGENRQDSVMSIPASTAERRFPDADNTVLYIRSRGELPATLVEAEAILRRLRRLAPEQDNDFTLSTSEQIIRTFDQVGAVIGFATIGLAAVSLLIGGIGIANVMVIAVTERTREIGVRLAVGARRAEVQRQFLLEAALLSLAGGISGLVVAAILTGVLTLALPGFAPLLPAWAVIFGLLASCTTGIVAGYLPAREASSLDPVEALRHD